MAVTIPYILFDVEIDRVMTFAENDKPFEKAREKARAEGLELSDEDKFSSWHVGIRPNTLFSNIVRVRNVDATDPWAITKAEIEARRRIYQHLAFFRAYVPGCEKAYVGKTGEQLGIRDSRRIVGEATLVADDCTSFRKREDTILRCAGPFDNTTRGSELTPIKDVETMYDYYDIPYGVIVPQKVDNVLIAGRSFSSDHLAHSGSRGMGLLMGMGQGAGTAASIMRQKKVAARDLPVKELQDTLTAQGMNL